MMTMSGVTENETDNALLRSWGYKPSITSPGYWVNPNTGSFRSRSEALTVCRGWQVIESQGGDLSWVKKRPRRV